MKVQYIGKNSKHRDRLYDTGARWSGPGDVQEIDEDVAAVMLRRHPDAYGPAVDGQPATNIEPSPANTGSTENTGDQKPTIQTAKVEIDGEWWPLSKLAKKKLDAYAQEHFGVNLDQRLKQAVLAEQVLELLQKSSADAPEGSEPEQNGEPDGTQSETGESVEAGDPGNDGDESGNENGNENGET